MKYSDLKDKDIKELHSLLKDEKVALGKLRFELSGKILQDPSKIKKTRNNIAKILTVLSQGTNK